MGWGRCVIAWLGLLGAGWSGGAAWAEPGGSAAALEEAARAAPEDYRALFALGAWRFEVELRCDEAPDLLERALARAPERPTPPDLRARALHGLMTCAERERAWGRLARWTEADARRAEAAGERPEVVASAWRRHAFALARVGREGEAEAVVGEVLRRDAGDVDARLLRASLRARRGAYEEALRDLRGTLDAQPPFIYLRIGQVLARMERWPQAREALETSLRQDGESPETWELLARCCAALGEADRAEEAYRRGLRLLEPGDARRPSVLNNLAWHLATRARLGDARLGEAQRLAEEAVQGSGGLEAAYTDTLAEVYVRQGRPGLALPWAEATARLAPWDRGFAARLARLRAQVRGLEGGGRVRVVPWEAELP